MHPKKPDFKPLILTGCFLRLGALQKAIRLYMGEKSWVFYIIVNGRKTYAGVSPDPVRRLRQHNGEISGGAKYTTGVGPGWTHICLVHGFRTNIEALQFEWAVKHEEPRGRGGMAMRARKLRQVLCKERWTSRAPPACDVPLRVQWMREDIPFDKESLPGYVFWLDAAATLTTGLPDK